MSCMTTPHRQHNKRHPLFGSIETGRDLGIAMLIADTAGGQYEPIGLASTSERRLSSQPKTCDAEFVI